MTVKKVLLIGGGVIAAAIVILLLIPVPDDFQGKPQYRTTKDQREFCAQVAATADADQYASLCDPDNKEAQKMFKEMGDGDRAAERRRE